MFKYGPYALAGTAVVVTMIAAMSISRGSISTLDLANKEQLKSVLPRPDHPRAPPLPTIAPLSFLARRAARSPPSPPPPCPASA